MTGRYDIHELLRQYGAEQLDRTPELHEITLKRHAIYYTDLLHDNEDTVHLGDRKELLREIDNIRAAWLWAVQNRDGGALLRGAAALHWLYHFQNWYAEAETMFQLAEDALSQFTQTAEGRFRIGALQLYRFFFQPDGEVTEQDVMSALSLWEGSPDCPEMCVPITRAVLNLRYISSKPSTLIALSNRAIDLCRRYHDQSGIAIALVNLAEYYCRFGDFERTRQLAGEALIIDKEIGFYLNSRWANQLLGFVSQTCGDYERAYEHFTQSLMDHIAHDIVRGMERAYFLNGMAALELDDFDTAQSHFSACIKIASELHRQFMVEQANAGLGLLDIFHGKRSEAEQRLHQIIMNWRLVGIQVLADNPGYDAVGKLALLVNQYEWASAYYETRLSMYKPHQRGMMMYFRCRTGLSQIGLGQQAEAKPHLFAALQNAVAMGATQIVFEALLGIAQLSDVSSSDAVRLLTLICDHPASNQFSRYQALQLLNEVTPLPETLPSLTLETAIALVSQYDSNPALPTPQLLVDPLSPRELEVLHLIAEGLNNREIAEQLFIGVSTVKKHINRIFSKLDAQHRTQAVVRAREHNILT